MIDLPKELRLKVHRAIRLIERAADMAEKNGGATLEICYSGGKDSDVILALARMAKVPCRPIYKNTTIDPPGTIAHVQQKYVEIRQPKMTFREIVEKRGIPGRLRRFCCEILKEYKISDYAVVGVRREESTARAERYHEPEQCRVYNNKEKARLYYPILDWTERDIAQFVEAMNIRCHPLYYDEKGNFRAERRLGCMGCPLVAPKKRIEEFKQHPGMVKLYVNAAQKFFDAHPDSKMRAYLDNAAEWFVMSIYCKSVAEFKERYKTDDLFGTKIDCRQFLENEFKIKL